MANKPKAVYAPGELDRVRGKLGELDAEEAMRMARILGGEVGYERTREEDERRKSRAGRIRRETVEMVVGPGQPGALGQTSKRRVDVIGAEEEGPENSPQKEAPSPKKGIRSHREAIDTGDDPSVPIKTSYFERIKMDRYAALPEFDIKSPSQVLVSMLSFFSDPPDYVNPLFVNRRIGDYYRRIEQLVTSTRALLPRNNLKRSGRLKKTSPFVFSILDTIRYWNIERITGDLARIQSHPRTVKVVEFTDILKAVYKPLFILEQLDQEVHIKGSYKLLYKLLYLENPMDAKARYQERIRSALSAFADIRRDVHYLLYPLMMRLISDRWFPYERLFIERRRRFMAFLNVSPQDQIDPADMAARQTEGANAEQSAAGEESAEQEKREGPADQENPATASGEPQEDPNDPEMIERKARRTAQDAEQKSLEQGLAALESLFPKAGWDRLSTFPDLYPYFADTFNLKKGYELIAPTDPLQQVAILMLILEELLFGLRYVSFGTINGADGSPIRVEDYLGSIINNWQRYIDMSFSKEYLPRLIEYCHILENTADSRNSVYARRTLNELHWAKRLYFLPYYHFESLGPPPFQKRDTTPIYGEIRLLRRYLTEVAQGVEQSNFQGGAGAQAPCDGIDNPWEPYNFEIPNPVSIRLDALLGPKKKNNASLIYFTLAVATVLDHLINNENSWAYEGRPGPLFRSVNGEGTMPLFGVETKLDANLIFRQMIKQRERERQRAAENNAKGVFEG
ncbi:MAG: hypothetical protein LBK27_01535 [Treponema sp.]|jgi:hypothetical protein|nr:hypothetical protein [Treponema sp.]